MGSASTSSHHRDFAISAGVSSLTAPQDSVNFLLHAARADLSGYMRCGNDLVVEFNAGRRLRIADFFLRGVDAHHLFVAEGNARWRVQLAPQAAQDGPLETRYEAAEGDSSTYLLGLLGAGLGAVGLAAAGGGSVSEGEGTTVTRPEPSLPTPRPIIDAISGQHTASGAFLNGKESVAIQGSGAAPFAWLSVLVNGQLAGTTQADAYGNWTYTVSQLPDGTHAISVTQMDASGKTNDLADISVVVDTTAPPAPQIASVSDNAGSIQGLMARGGSTDDRTPMLTGSAEAGSTVRIFDGGTQIGELGVGDDGQWQFTTPLLGDGRHLLSVRATDAAGNESQPSEPFELIVDTTAPAIPRIDSINDGAMGERDSFDTRDMQPTLKGRAEAHSTVALYDGDKLLGRVTADGDGQWRYAPAAALADGIYRLTVKATDAAGNESKPSATLALIVDSTAPPAPQIDRVSDDAGPVRGTIAPGGSTDDRTPTLSGRAEAGSTLRIYDGGFMQIGVLVVGDDGRWQFKTPMLDNGPHLLTVTATDAVGNESRPSAAFALTIDTIAPAIPSIDSISDGAIGEQVPFVTKQAQPTIKGRAEAHSMVTLKIGDAESVTVKADGSGQWRYTPGAALPDGIYQLTVKATDGAGNVSEASEPIALTVDSTAPAIPSIDSINDGAIGEQVSLITKHAQPTIKGRAEAHSTVGIYDGDKLLVSVTADKDGQWSYAPATALADAIYQLTVKATDAAGNVSEASEPIVFTVDTMAPVLKIIEVSAAQRPTISGEAEPGSVVRIFNGEALLGVADMDQDGAWHYQPDLEDGSYQLSASATDVAGNESLPRTTFALTIDHSPPEVPEITTVIEGGYTRDAQPTLEGLAEANGKVTLYNGGQMLGTADVDDQGHWSFRPQTPLPDAEYHLTVRVADAAGNVSEASEPVVFTVDTTPPAEVDVSVETWPEINGLALPGSLVKIYVDGSPVAVVSTEAQASGAWSTPVPLADGKYQLTVTATDQAGNENRGVVIDVDTRPVIDSVVDGFGAVRGAVEFNGTTDDWRPLISGKGTPDSILTIYSNGVEIGEAVVSHQGVWEFKPPSILKNGFHALTITSTNFLGYTSTPGESFDFNVNSSAKPFSIYNSNHEEFAVAGVLPDKKLFYEGYVMPGSILNISLNYQDYFNNQLREVHSVKSDDNGYWSIEGNFGVVGIEVLPNVIVGYSYFDAVTEIFTSRELAIRLIHSTRSSIDSNEFSILHGGEIHAAQEGGAVVKTTSDARGEKDLVITSDESGNSSSERASTESDLLRSMTEGIGPEGDPGAVSEGSGAHVAPAAPYADSTLLMPLPEQAPMDYEFRLDAGEPEPVPSQGRASGTPEGLADFGLAPDRSDGSPHDLAQLLAAGDVVQDKEMAGAIGPDCNATAQEALAIVNTIADAERDAGAVDLSAYALALTADTGAEWERLLAQHALAAV